MYAMTSKENNIWHGLSMNTIYNMDCIEGMKLIPDNSIDSIVTDPPYEIWFMGKWWDDTGIANNVDMWKECLRVLKPWGYLLSFWWTRTYHRMASAIEDAGFEIRNFITRAYWSWFPKSLNISKQLEKQWYIEEAKEWNWRWTALKPAIEPICMAMKPLEKWLWFAENCLKWGTGGINIDESRVWTEEKLGRQASSTTMFGNGKMTKEDVIDNSNWLGRFPANLIHDNSEEVRECFPETKSTPRTATIGGTGGVGVNTNFQRGSETSNYTDSGNASRFFKSIIYQAKASKSERNKGCEGLEERQYSHDGREKEIDNPYQRNKSVATNNHPTVKPVALMEYLIKMVTPKGGIVLDPFAGSGSTLVAAKQNWYGYIGIEMTEEYIPIIEARLKVL